MDNKNYDIICAIDSMVEQTAASSLVDQECSVGLPTNLGYYATYDYGQGFGLDDRHFSNMTSTTDNETCLSGSRVEQTAASSLVDHESSMGTPITVGKYNDECLSKNDFEHLALRPSYLKVNLCDKHCSICKWTENAQAVQLVNLGYQMIESDEVDGQLGTKLKEIRRVMYKVYALGLEVTDLAIGVRRCFCDFVARVNKLRGIVVKDTRGESSVCACCKISCDVRVCNIFTTSLHQIDLIDEKTTRPLINRLSKKINVLVNALRQLKHFACEPCKCSAHKADDRCVCGVVKHIDNIQERLSNRVYAASGIENTSVETISNVNMMDQREIVSDMGFVTGNKTMSHKGLSMSEDQWNLVKLLERPTVIATLPWGKDVTTIISTKVIPYDVVLGNFKNIFSMFTYFRGSLKLRFQVNGTKFHVGKLLIYYFPYPSTSNEVNNYPLDSALAFPHVLLDASMSNSGELSIPFSHMLSYFNVMTKDSRCRLGEIRVIPFNALKVATGVTSSLNVTMWASFADVELHQPYAHKVALPIAAMGFEGRKYPNFDDVVEEDESVVVDRGDAGLTVASVGKSAQGISNTFGDLAKVASGIAAGARLVMNLDKPLREKVPERWVPTAISDVAHGVGQDQCIRLGLLPKSALDTTAQAISTVDSDMKVLTIARQKTRLKKVSWKNSDTAGKLLYAIPIVPTVVNNDAITQGTGYSKYAVTNLAYCSRAFCYWKGSIVVSFDVVASIMHTGRLMAAFVAGKFDATATVADVRNSALMVMDLQESKSFTCTVPYMSATPWMRCDKLIPDNDGLSKDDATGYLYLLVLNELAVPSGVSNEVEINVDIAAGSDFQLAVPSDLSRFLSNNDTPPLAPEKVEAAASWVVPVTKYLAPPGGVVVSVKPLVQPEIIVEVSRDEGTKLVPTPRLDDRETLAAMRERMETTNFKEFTDNADFRAHWDDRLFNLIEDERVFYTLIPSYLQEILPLDKKLIPADMLGGNPNTLKPFNSSELNTRLRDLGMFGNLSKKYFYLYDKNSKSRFYVYVKHSERVVVRHDVVMDINTFVTNDFMVDRLALMLWAYHMDIVLTPAEFGQLLDLPTGASGMEHLQGSRNNEEGVVMALGNRRIDDSTSRTMTENAMDMQTVLRRYYPIHVKKYLINNTDISNVPYFVFPVTPVLASTCNYYNQVTRKPDGTKNEATVGAMNYNHINHFAGLFTFWRGSMRYKIITSSAEVSDVIMVVVYRPNITCQKEMQTIKYVNVNNYLSVLSYGSVLYQGKVQASIEFEVPYHSKYNQLTLYHPVSNGVYSLDSVNGCVQVFFVGAKDNLSMQLQLYTSLGDDCMFSYLRGAPYIYTKSKTEAKRDLGDDAEIVDFHNGTSLGSSGVPIAAMGLFDFMKKTRDVVDVAHDHIPDFVNMVEGGSRMANIFEQFLSGVKVGWDVTVLVCDIMNIADAWEKAWESDGWFKLVHITRIIATIATRMQVTLTSTLIGRFVSACLNIVGRWPEDRNILVGTSGLTGGVMVPVCVAIIGFVCDRALPTSGIDKMAKKIIPCFRFINEGTRSAGTIMSWVEPFMDLVREYAYSKLLKVFPGLASWLKVSNKVNDIVDWMRDIDHIDEDLVSIRVAKDIEYRHFLMGLYDKAIEYTEHIASGDDKHLASTIRSYAKQIIRIYNEIIYMENSPSSRVDPYCICLVGAPGGGKSAMLPTLINRILNKMEYPKQNRIYARNSSDKYWSRYKGELAVVMDDYDQIVDSPAVKELIDIKTNNIYQLDQAAIEKKGQLFVSELVVLTTNTKYPNRVEITEKEALWRRRNSLVEVIKNNGPFDEEGFSHLWFRFLDPINPEGKRSNIMNLDELIVCLCERVKPYLERQYALVARNEGLAYASAGETLHLDMESIANEPEFAAFEPRMFEKVVGIRDGIDFIWRCETDEEHLQVEWNDFKMIYFDVTKNLRKHLIRNRSSYYDEFKKYMLSICDSVWQSIKSNPILVGIAVVMALLVGWRYYSSIKVKAELAANATYMANTMKMPTRHVMAAYGIDVNAESLIEHRVLPYIYRLRVTLVDGMQGYQNAFALGDRWIITVRHAFSSQYAQKCSSVCFELHYCGKWLKFEIDKKDWRLRDNTDLIILKLDSRFHEHRDNIRHFVDENDLGKLRSFPASYVGAENSEEKIVRRIDVKPITKMTYMDTYDMHEIQIYKAWQYLGVDKMSTCGGIIVAHETHVVGKFVGIHVAACPGSGFSHVVTRQMLEEMMGGVVVKSCGIPIPATVGPLPATFPDGHFGYIGVTTDRVGIVNKTELVPSVIQGEVGEVNTGPSVLSSKDPRLTIKLSPMYRAIIKLGDPSVNLTSYLINLVTQGLIARYAILDTNYARLLTDHESIFGGDGIDYIDRINMATSPGHPYINDPARGRGKAWMFDDEVTRITHKPLLGRLALRESEGRLHRRIESVWIDCLKDEKRALEKIKEGSTRLFQIPPLDFTILTRKYFLGFGAALMHGRRELASQVGINPYGPDWTHLYNKLDGFTQFFLSGDYKNFDKYTLPQIMEQFGVVAQAFYDRTTVPFDDVEGDKNMREVLIEEMIHTCHVYCDKIYVSHHGNPSGNPLTTILNGFVNEFYIILAWFFIHIDMGLHTTVEEFFTYVILVVYGDDNNIGVKREKTDIFNQQNIARVLKKYLNIDYTDESKKGVSDFKNLDQITFLKNGFKKHPEYPMYVMATLDKNTIREMCNWVKGTIDITEASKENATNSCRFAYFHGPEFYKEWATKLNKAFCEQGVVWSAPSYESYDGWFLNQFAEN